MYYRKISPYLIEAIKQYPVVTILGPRQSGKTTLVTHLFADFEYRSLEDPDVREMAKADPRGFLNKLGDKVILDEVQRLPEVTSYIQSLVDEPKSQKKFVLTGSNGTMLIDSVTQTLAGRTQLFELLPLAVRRLCKKIMILC